MVMVLGMNLTKMNNILLVDIGGTNMRHAIASSASNEISDLSKSAFSDMTEFEDKLEDLITNNFIDILIASVAGPKINNCISMTNRDYIFDSIKIAKKFNLKECYLLNDWEAIAHSYDYVSNSIKSIKDGKSFNENKLFIGPGTGLGAAVCINNEVILPTEVGNTTNSTEFMLNIFKVNNANPITLENVISGSAISNIYKIKTNKSLSSEEIFRRFIKEDQIATEVINSFIKSLAYTLSDLALTFNIGKSILFAGSLMRSLYPHIDKDIFHIDFINNKKNIHKDMLNAVHIGVITKEGSPLYGNLGFYKKLKN